MPAPPNEITSSTNPLIKTLRSLERKKGRRETGLFLAEGARLVQQGLDAGWSPAIILATQDALNRESTKLLAQTAIMHGARLATVSPRVMSQVARKDNPQTLLGVFHQQSNTLDSLNPTRASLWIALYEVRDPGNLGTVLRTADCAGVAGVILLETCCDLYSLETVRASMGSIFDVPTARASYAAFDAWRRAADITMTAASINGQIRHDKTDYGPRGIILMGNEQAGLPSTVEADCDKLVRIPMRGGADSLNLAQATAIMTYEAWRQRDFTGSGVRQ